MRGLALAVSVFVWLSLGGCDASGCGTGVTPLPAGFPANARVAHATQLRVSSTGMEALEAEPELVVAELLGGSLAFDVPASCGGSPATCCTGGTPVSPCGPLLFDLAQQDGDLPRLELSPQQGASRIDVTLRARVTSQSDVPLNIPTVGDCTMRFDTAPGATEDIAIMLPLNLTQDPQAGTTRMVAGTPVLTGLTSDDVSLGGGFGCAFADLGTGFFIGTLTDTIASWIQDRLATLTCKACPSGDVAECGAFADACTDRVCMDGAECLQEIGVVGRVSSGALFSGAPPGSAGGLDLYEVAGGYGTTNDGGFALGVLAGALASGAERDRCGPTAAAPTPAVVPLSTYFQGNTRPDTLAPYDLAIGFHESQLETLAWAAYEGGVLCPTVDSSVAPALTSATLEAALPSLAELTEGERPIAVGLRPQAPPSFTLGANTFDGSDEVLEPLLDLRFDGMELDLFVEVEQQPIRVLTLVADVHAPIGVRIDGTGALEPVLGATAGAQNVSVESSQGLTESASELQALAPLLVDAALPELVARLDVSNLPTLAGLQLAFTSVTSVDNQDFLALFAELQAPPSSLVAAAPAAVERTQVAVPAGIGSGAHAVGRAWLDPRYLACVGLLGLAWFFAARRRARRWALGAAIFAIVVALPVACGDDDGGGGATHDAGSDASVDGGNSGESGGGGAGGSAGVDGGAAGTDGGQGAAGGEGGDAGDGGSGDENPCGSQDCEPGDVDHGDLGQWSSVATGSRTVIASYDAELGDLVLVELDDGEQRWRVLDGVPDETPTHEPDGYRGGVEQAGPDVGAWTSVRLDGSRVAVAYQDRDRGALRAAFEDEDGDFHPHVVDDSDTDGVELGAYASLALGDTPSIAYLATSVPGAGDELLTELRLATANTSTPTDEDDWTTTVVASAVVEASDALGLPDGPGLFVELVVLEDGRRVLVHHDRAQRALVAHVESSAGSESFDEVLLDGGGALDRGRWAAAVADDDGLIHVAYQDSIGHQVLYLTFDPDGSVSAPEVADDGTRGGDRPHWVGAGIALWLDDDEPRIAYQDAVTADVAIATRDGSWSVEDATNGAALDGFHLAAPVQGPGPLVWDRVDPSDSPRHRLVVIDEP